MRRIADLSQRQLAGRLGVAASTVAKLETGKVVPRVDAFERILALAGLRLVAVDADNRRVLPMRVWQETYDGAGRRYPAHLDTILDPEYGEWWADIYGLYRPPETYRRSRAYRDAKRRRSVWDTRVAQHRHEPAPPDPDGPYWRDPT